MTADGNGRPELVFFVESLKIRKKAPANPQIQLTLYMVFQSTVVESHTQFLVDFPAPAAAATTSSTTRQSRQQVFSFLWLLTPQHSKSQRDAVLTKRLASLWWWCCCCCAWTEDRQSDRKGYNTAYRSSLLPWCCCCCCISSKFVFSSSSLVSLSLAPCGKRASPHTHESSDDDDGRGPVLPRFAAAVGVLPGRHGRNDV